MSLGKVITWYQRDGCCSAASHHGLAESRTLAWYKAESTGRGERSFKKELKSAKNEPPCGDALGYVPEVCRLHAPAVPDTCAEVHTDESFSNTLLNSVTGPVPVTVKITVVVWVAPLPVPVIVTV
jgi:hypothetical protein